MTQTEANQSDRSAYSLLAACIGQILAAEVQEMEKVTICFSSVPEARQYAPGVGLRAALESFWTESLAKPVIILGLENTGEAPGERGRNTDERLAKLLEWPGAAYLTYGFTKERLIATARRVVEGAKSPLPAELLPTPEDILRSTSEVRHWLENRLSNTVAALEDFRTAARGEVALHPSHLEPAVAISKQHQQMLDRLWDFDLLVQRLVPTMGRLKVVKATVAEFKAHWHALEAARASCRVAGAAGDLRGQLAEDVIRELEGVCSSLAAVIEATRRVDHEIKLKQTGGITAGIHISDERW